jgi:hypothetical protein
VPATVGVRVWVPLVANDPFQVPDARQLVALRDDHVNVVDVLVTTEVAAKFNVGAAGGGIAAIARLTGVAAVDPIALLQVSEKFSVPGTVPVTT